MDKIAHDPVQDEHGTLSGATPLSILMLTTRVADAGFGSFVHMPFPPVLGNQYYDSGCGRDGLR